MVLMSYLSSGGLYSTLIAVANETRIIYKRKKSQPLIYLLIFYYYV